MFEFLERQACSFSGQCRIYAVGAFQIAKDSGLNLEKKWATGDGGRLSIIVHRGFGQVYKSEGWLPTESVL